MKEKDIIVVSVKIQYNILQIDVLIDLSIYKNQN